MRKINYSFILILSLFVFSESFAQIPDTTKTLSRDKEFANPSVLGMGKSKGLIINYEWQPNFGITSTSGTFGNRVAEVRRNNKLHIKAYVPLVNHPHFKLVGGFNYAFEEFNFENIQPPTDYPFYTNLEDKNLKKIGGQFVMLRPVDENNFYIVRFKGELNGDYSSREVAVSDYLKTTVEFLYGWKKSPSLSYGFGAQLGYALGRRRIYPAFLYNRTFNNKWGIEALLPANADLRYNASEKSLWFGGVMVEGASYNINLQKPSVTDLETLELRRSEVRARIRWEREIYDFLWFGAETGYRTNFSFDGYEKEAGDGFIFSKKEPPLIDNKLKGAVLFNLELFIVPPKRFLKP